MKSMFLALAAILALPVFATSPMPAHVHSLSELNSILKDKEVVKALAEKAESIDSITHEKLKSGDWGWVIQTKSCKFDTRVVKKLVKPIPRHPFGGLHETSVQIAACR